MDHGRDGRAALKPEAPRARRAAGTLLVAGTVALALVSPASGGTAPKKRVTVADNYFAPMNFKVEKGTKIVWRWSRDNVEEHDVKLVRRPKGVRRFHSDAAVTDYVFRRKLRKRGKYKVICTFHRVLMRQTITVK